MVTLDFIYVTSQFWLMDIQAYFKITIDIILFQIFKTFKNPSLAPFLVPKLNNDSLLPVSDDSFSLKKHVIQQEGWKRKEGEKCFSEQWNVWLEGHKRDNAEKTKLV